MPNPAPPFVALIGIFLQDQTLDKPTHRDYTYFVVKDFNFKLNHTFF